jgi:uncharacterized protein with ParB-like and HNH nuclease domain
MQFSQKNILEFFDSSQKSFIIPVYQRAYSWEKVQWETLLNDLKEQIKGNNNNFFGNLLLETVKKGSTYEIIDGQQRLTTVLIFMRSLFTVLKNKKEEGEEIEIDFDEKEKIYFRNGGNIKLRPVQYDRAFFDTIIIEGKDDFEANTASQIKIKSAKTYFTDKLDYL